MAEAGSSSYLSGALLAHIESGAIVAFSDANRLLPLVTTAAPARADTIAWTVWNRGSNKVTSASVTAAGGGEISETKIDSQKKTATPALLSVRLPLQQEAKLSNVDSPEAKIPELIGNAMAAKVDNLLAQAMDAFTNTVGNSTIAITVDNIFTAIQTLEQNGAIGSPTMVLHPKQIWGANGLSADLVVTTQFGGTVAPQEAMIATGQVGPVAGIPIVSTRELDENSTATKGGMLTPNALGFGWVGQLITVEFERKGTHLEDNWIGWMFAAQAELDDLSGVEIWTKTT